MNSIRSTPVENSTEMELFDTLQRGDIQYFIDNVTPTNGLVADSTWEEVPIHNCSANMASPAA